MRTSPNGRRARAREGRYLGIGLGNGMKGTGRGPFESGIVRIGRSGRISVYTGAMPMGQGIRTALAQICAEQFGVPPDEVTVVAGDTAVIPHGQGGFASRQTITAGSAVHLAAVAVREKALAVAAHLLEASPDDLDMHDGRIEVAGVPGSGVTLRMVAEAVSGVPGYSLPGTFEPGLESMQNFIPPTLTYGLGCHAVELEVDIDTCGVRILRYVVVNDSGRVINPMIVEGQIVGGVAHGIGNALLELMAYDDQAQPMTTNFADYLLPGSTEVPKIEVTLRRISVAAQSARRQRRRRIRLRAGGRRDRLGDRERARAVRRADQRISGDAGAAVRAARREALVLAGLLPGDTARTRPSRRQRSRR